ncbi:MULTISPECIES: GLPGLI family protein [unclassified Spirosoma]|uniref:GLPGLI family protein n=1 Tax=unclassified Spirosoma TaxID=2621999 RepID=UPI000961D57E|nr:MULTISPECIES: GLPGLI family protein [unclassified Spirosoma]MBN8823545.1 GLPGLI family protein [Spirosoma sp.]OJW71850.1 MAG: GLPGLI family protein [Spirosoma sp. 48-14]
MKKLVLVLCLMVSSMAMAQKTEGVVTYVRKDYWSKMISRLTFLSQEQKDRQTQLRKNWEENNKGTKMKMAFNANESLYTYFSTEPEEGGYSWRQYELDLYRNFEKDKKTDIIEMLGKTYVVEDSIHAPVWKIGNQIKEVAGFICMKAETEDPVKNQKITAWFAQDIPVSAGPERMCGLPGLILELNIDDGTVIIEATNVAFRPLTADDLKLPKVKGKKIDDAAYDKVIRQYIAQQTVAHENPYWEIRY